MKFPAELSDEKVIPVTKSPTRYATGYCKQFRGDQWRAHLHLSQQLYLASGVQPSVLLFV